MADMRTWRGSLGLWGVGLICLLVLMGWHSVGMGLVNHCRALTVVTLLGDGVLLLCPYWLLGRCCRCCYVVVVVVLLSLLCVVNRVYYGYMGDGLPVTFLTMTGNVNGELAGMAWHEAGWWLLWCMVPVAVVAVAAVVTGRRVVREAVLPWRWRGVAVSGSVLIYVLAQLGVTLHVLHYERVNGLIEDYARSFRETNRQRMVGGNSSNINQWIDDSGYVVAMVRAGVAAGELRALRRELTAGEAEAIDGFLDARPVWEPISGNVGKNVVVLVVESLNADVVWRRAGGREVTPVLNGLLAAEGTVASLGVRTQVRDGLSSDGQLMLNAGVRPPERGVASVLLVPGCDFASLAGLSGREVAGVVLADDGVIWNQSTALRCYGFERVVTRRDYEAEAAERGADGAMFGRGLELIDSAGRPFLLELITMSMHVPFDDPVVTGPYGWIEAGADVHAQEVGYLRSAAYFDEQLGWFIGALRERGLWDDTLLFIASDHPQDWGVRPELRGRMQEMASVFMGVNTGVTERVGKSVGQVDVFPTILHLCGVSPRYRGVGTSMLLPEVTCEADSVSELMLRGDHLYQR